MLEEYGHAVKRGADIICEVAGYGASCDAYHITAPQADGAYAARCMVNAMRDARISPEEMDYINAHGTSTPMNDRCETAAVKLAFGHILRSAAMALMWGAALYAGVRSAFAFFAAPGLAAYLSTYLIEPVFRPFEQQEQT